MNDPALPNDEHLNAPNIGPALHRRRRSRGLTLTQLAAISGVSKSMLSQVERGQANPTFAVLWSLTRALEIEFAELLDGRTGHVSDNTIDVVSVAHTPEMRSADGSCWLRILSPPELSGKMEWYEVEMLSGGALESRPHSSGAHEHFTAFDDGFEITSGASERSIKAGETARYPADVMHKIANRSKSRAKGLMIVLFQ